MVVGLTGMALEFQNTFQNSKKLMFKCLVHTLCIEILSYLFSQKRLNKNEQDHSCLVLKPVRLLDCYNVAVLQLNVHNLNFPAARSLLSGLLQCSLGFALLLTIS